MPCYAINPVILGISDCRRTVCIHCRVDFRFPALIDAERASCEDILRNDPTTPRSWSPPLLVPQGQ